MPLSGCAAGAGAGSHSLFHLHDLVDWGPRAAQAKTPNEEGGWAACATRPPLISLGPLVLICWPPPWVLALQELQLHVHICASHNYCIFAVIPGPTALRCRSVRNTICFRPRPGPQGSPNIQGLVSRSDQHLARTSPSLRKPRRQVCQQYQRHLAKCGCRCLFGEHRRQNHLHTS